MARVGDTVVVLACQIDVPDPMTCAAQRDAHVARVAAAIADAARRASRPIDVVALPEVSTIGYSADTMHHLDVLAERVFDTPGNNDFSEAPSCAAFARLAADLGAVVCFGLPRVDPTASPADPRRYRIAQVVLQPDGTLGGVYDKLHVAHFGCCAEKDFFAPPPQVAASCTSTTGGVPGHPTTGRLVTFSVRGVTFAPTICYDIRFPEVTRALANAGVDVVLHCSAFARDETFMSREHFAVTRAVENQVLLVSLNRAGADYGRSLIVPPWVDAANPVVAMPEHDEAFHVLTVTAADIDAVRRTYPFRNDRRADYAALPVLKVPPVAGAGAASA